MRIFQLYRSQADDIPEEHCGTFTTEQAARRFAEKRLDDERDDGMDIELPRWERNEAYGPGVVVDMANDYLEFYIVPDELRE